MMPEIIQCYLVRKTGKDQIESGVESRPAHDLPAGEVLIKVAYSSPCSCKNEDLFQARIPVRLDVGSYFACCLVPFPNITFREV